MKTAAPNTKPLKIGLFIASDPSTTGGIQEYVYRLMLEFEKQNHIVTVYGPRPENKLLYPFTRYVPVSKTYHVNLKNGFQPTINGPIFPLINFNEDILHIHEPYVPFITGRAPFISSALVKIASFHTGWEVSENPDPWIKFITASLPIIKPLYSSYYDGVTYCSQFVKQNWDILFNNKIPSKIIHYGADKSQFYKKSDHRLNILFLARLVPRKGVLDFIQAISLIPKHILKNTAISIVGDGPEKNEAIDLVRKYKLQTIVTFYGEIAGEKRLNYIRRANIFVAPYRNEGFGLTILEAIQSGCTIVGYMNEVFKESLLRYPEPDLLSPKGNIPILAKNLTRVLKDTKLRSRIQLWGKQHLKSFSWKKTATETLNFYRQLLSKKAV
ncbi:MAG: glycosyltransferase family 4 protein [Patescibacteria group bacterium]